MDNTREKLIELLNNSFDEQYSKRGLLTAPHTAGHLIANGVTVKKWIPVTEPPKERGCYLISVKHWLDGKPVTREAFWNGADWLSCYWKKGDRVELTPRVTHWMPLPEAPT
jgi:hypothetical protein